MVTAVNGSPVITGNTFSGPALNECFGGDGNNLLLYDAAATVTGNTFGSALRGVVVSGASQGVAPMLTSNTIRSLATAIQVVRASNVTITGNTLQSNTTAIAIDGSPVTSNVTGNTFDRNTRALAYGTGSDFGSSFPAGFQSNTFLGPASTNVIRLPGSLGSGSLAAMPVAYATGNLTIPAASTVVLDAGTIIQADAGASITADGELICAGSSSAPVTLTSATKASGRWAGLTVRNKSTLSPSAIDSCILEYAGASGQPALKLDNASIIVTDSIITDNSANGIDVLNGSAAPSRTARSCMNGAHGIRVAVSNPAIREAPFSAPSTA